MVVCVCVFFLTHVYLAGRHAALVSLLTHALPHLLLIALQLLLREYLLLIQRLTEKQTFNFTFHIHFFKFISATLPYFTDDNRYDNIQLAFAIFPHQVAKEEIFDFTLHFHYLLYFFLQPFLILQIILDSIRYSFILRYSY